MHPNAFTITDLAITHHRICFRLDRNTSKSIAVDAAPFDPALSVVVHVDASTLCRITDIAVAD